MEQIMYVCPNCEKLFKVKGEHKSIRCSQCSINLVDMKISFDSWNKLSKDERSNIKRIYIDGSHGGIEKESNKSHNAKNSQNSGKSNKSEEISEDVLNDSDNERTHLLETIKKRHLKLFRETLT